MSKKDELSKSKNHFDKRIKQVLYLWCILLLCAGVSIACIPALSNFDEKSAIRYVLPAIFWLVIIASFVTSAIMKSFLIQNEKLAKQYINGKKYPGIISFSKQNESIVTYCVFIVGLLLIVADAIWIFLPKTIAFCVISITLMAFLLHCVLDGKCYLIYKKIRENKNEK